MSKFLKFRKKIHEGETCYRVENITKNDVLGYISYFKKWKKWIFQPEEKAYFDDFCLMDIATFMGDLN